MLIRNLSKLLHLFLLLFFSCKKEEITPVEAQTKTYQFEHVVYFIKGTHNLYTISVKIPGYMYNTQDSTGIWMAGGNDTIGGIRYFNVKSSSDTGTVTCIYKSNDNIVDSLTMSGANLDITISH